ncbi:hypothetical protein [Photobacterium lipolyticum]|uniref:hypothetical protein n=1 Tax=Photobacterium lipolyticum TaxID=266810 RepID=UPI0014760BC1|nr:hypothetical protein [Photobacterium lipolyticum]
MFELTEEQINLVSGAGASEENRPTNPGGVNGGSNEENRPPRPPRPPYVGEEGRY